MTEIATLAGGCFWCTEAIFKRLRGVDSVVSGYAGGKIENPSYEQVSWGNTGHAEAVQIKFDPKVISYEKLLEIFWATHNPTTPDQQGNDHGPQYRSIIFYHSKKQQTQAAKSKTNLANSRVFFDPIVTEILPFLNFYAAEDHHQNFYDRNGDAPYCDLVISPKLKKLIYQFGQDVKEEYR